MSKVLASLPGNKLAKRPDMILTLKSGTQSSRDDSKSWKP